MESTLTTTSKRRFIFEYSGTAYRTDGQWYCDNPDVLSLAELSSDGIETDVWFDDLPQTLQNEILDHIAECICDGFATGELTNEEGN